MAENKFNLKYGVAFFFVILFISFLILLVFSPTNDSLYWKAGKTRDISYCYKIKDTGDRDECIGWVAWMARNDTICDLITSQLDKDDCYLKLSSYLNISDMNQTITDLELCPKIIDKWHQSKCYNEIAVLQNNSELCNNMYYNGVKNYFDDKDDCFKTIAINTKNPKLCNRITVDDKDLELSHLEECQAAAENNETKCNSITNDFFKDTCFGRLARFNLNISFCDKMSGQHNDDRLSNINDCYYDVAKLINPKTKCNSTERCLEFLGVIKTN